MSTSVPILAALPVLAVYWLTLAPTLTWAHYGADGGDLIAAVARGGLPHPPGFPTYLLFSELFLRMPWGDPAGRLNLMSAAMAAGAAGFVSIAAGRLTRMSEGIAAICAGLCFGLAPLLWSQAIITEVYALAACFAALMGYLALRGAPMWMLGFTWGIGLGAHPVIILFAPLVVWVTWQENAARMGRLIQAALGALVGWGILYGGVVVARGGVPSPWGGVDTPSGWWTFVSAQTYHGYLFSLPLSALPQRIVAWLSTSVRQFTPIGAVIMLVGWFDLWRTRRAFGITSLIVAGAISLFSIAYNTTDSIVYLTLALPLAALWLAVGLLRASGWLRRRWQFGNWLILLLPVLQLALFWGEVDLHSDWTAMNWAEGVLSAAPPRAILRTAEDASTFTLWYAHDVLGKRPDIAVVDRDLWQNESYRAMVLGELGLDATVSLDEAVSVMDRPLVDVEMPILGERR